MRGILGLAPVLVVVCASACAPPWDEPEGDPADEHHSTVGYGNAASLPGNAASLPGNAASLPGNAASLPGNAGLIAVTEANALMVKPRISSTTTCGVYSLASSWEFASSYRCNGSGRIHTSDIQVNGVNLGSRLCSSCGTATQRRVYLPATLGSVGQSSTLDVVLEIDFAGPSEYECTKREYAVMVYNLRISADGCQTFTNPDLVTAVPAPQRLFTTASSAVPRGQGWGLVVAATTDSAVFKSTHFTKIVDTFYAERPDAWMYGYPTTNLGCNTPGSSCLSGASMLLEYSMALANLAPVNAGGITYGIPGTVTGVPTWLSFVTANGILNRTYVEVGASSVPNDYVTPGPRERTVPTYAYDAVFGPGTHFFATSRAAYGPARTRVNLMRHKFCGGIVACPDAVLAGALITNYEMGAAISPGGAGLDIEEIYGAVGADAPFFVTAMPELGATASCSPETDEDKKPVDVPNGPTFCIPPPPPPPQNPGSGSGTGTGS